MARSGHFLLNMFLPNTFSRTAPISDPLRLYMVYIIHLYSQMSRDLRTFSLTIDQLYEHLYSPQVVAEN